MSSNKETSIGNKTVVGIIVGIVVLFLIMAVIPQGFWVDVSMKLFK